MTTVAAPPTTRAKTAGPPGQRYSWSARAFAAPSLILVAIALYLPFVWTGYLSFTKYSGVGKASWIGIQNYRDMFSNPEFYNAMLNTVYWVVGTIALPVALGLAIALLAHGIRGSCWYKLPFLAVRHLRCRGRHHLDLHPADRRRAH